MFEFDIAVCVIAIIIIPFECNGSNRVSICVNHDSGEINYEFYDIDECGIPP